MRSRTATILLVLVILDIAVGGLYVSLFFSLKNKNEATSALFNEVVGGSARADRLRAIKTAIDETAEKRAKIDSYFVGHEGVVSFLESLESLARGSGVEFKVNAVDVAGNETTASSEQEFLALSLEAKGTFAAVHRFLALLETIPFQLRWKQVRVSEFSSAEPAGKVPLLWRGDFDVGVLKIK